MPVAADALLLREALSNLIDNALRYAGRGASVTVRAHQRENACVLEVEDNGPGLSPQDLTRVFERFWRASDLPGGCGLGLAIVAEIAQRHGGRAEAHGQTPQGLVLRLVLPRPGT
jgi:two-component system sensor histidine kinase TctE